MGGNDILISPEDIDKTYDRLYKEAEVNGYHLNPDIEFTKSLIKGLLVNEKRYGYMACPCRLASGKKEEDLDIICPCDYRDADILEFDACYCGFYVSDKILKSENKIHPVPERRLPKKERDTKSKEGKKPVGTLPYPVWRCKVCGYLCARDNPPEICPVCKAKKERFERFM